MPHASSPVLPVRQLGSIAAAAAVGLILLVATVLGLTALLAPGEAGGLVRLLGVAAPMAAACFLAYFAVASVLARRSSSPRTTLGTCAVLTSAVVALWFSGGLGYGTTLSEAWLSGLGGLGVLSASLLVGSAVLYRLDIVRGAA